MKIYKNNIKTRASYGIGLYEKPSEYEKPVVFRYSNFPALELYSFANDDGIKNELSVSSTIGDKSIYNNIYEALNDSEWKELYQKLVTYLDFYMISSEAANDKYINAMRSCFNPGVFDNTKNFNDFKESNSFVIKAIKLYDKEFLTKDALVSIIRENPISFKDFDVINGGVRNDNDMMGEFYLVYLYILAERKCIEFISFIKSFKNSMSKKENISSLDIEEAKKCLRNMYPFYGIRKDEYDKKNIMELTCYFGDISLPIVDEFEKKLQQFDLTLSEVREIWHYTLNMNINNDRISLKRINDKLHYKTK